MTKKRRILLATFAIVLLLVASNIQGKNIGQTSDLEIETDEESTCFALLHGRVGKSHSYAWESFPFALVDAEIKQTRTGILGIYRMILPLGTYNVTAYYKGYEPLTKQITLTKEFSERELNFDFIESTPVELQPTPYIYDIFILGKVSNVILGGYTPAYWFHIDKVITIGNQDPRIQLIENREGFMLSMDFRGFVFKNIIIGKVSSLLIYD